MPENSCITQVENLLIFSPGKSNQRMARSPSRSIWKAFFVGAGWALAAVLWSAAEVFALVLARLPGGADNLAAAGMRGIGTTSRALLVGIPLVIVTVSDESVGIAAAGLYAVVFTVELAVGLVSYFGGEVKA